MTKILKHSINIVVGFLLIFQISYSRYKVLSYTVTDNRIKLVLVEHFQNKINAYYPINTHPNSSSYMIDLIKHAVQYNLSVDIPSSYKESDDEIEIYEMTLINTVLIADIKAREKMAKETMSNTGN